MKRYSITLLLASTLLLSACESCDNYAPVTEISEIEPIPQSGLHQVHQGETLYEVAWRYGLDYRDVAAENRMQAPYSLRKGQALQLRGNEYVKRSTVIDANAAVKQWKWPAEGMIINAYSNRTKGINIAGVGGAPIYATAAGKVVYAGNGLRAYGNLIIIKHNNIYLSAYAHANTIYVHEGEMVEQGQKIAAMGNSGARRVMLHFEIRRAGTPVDPMKLLKN